MVQNVRFVLSGWRMWLDSNIQQLLCQKPRAEPRGNQPPPSAPASLVLQLLTPKEAKQNPHSVKWRGQSEEEDGRSNPDEVSPPQVCPTEPEHSGTFSTLPQSHLSGAARAARLVLSGGRRFGRDGRLAFRSKRDLRKSRAEWAS